MVYSWRWKGFVFDLYEGEKSTLTPYKLVITTERLYNLQESYNVVLQNLWL